MFRRSFVSVYFLPEKLAILQLTPNKKKVAKKALVDLPKDLIKNFRVTDTRQLALLIKEAWSKFHIREKSVGLILPEFSTFTKILTLPRLKPFELDEAVRWQVQEHLPQAPSELVMDWKIVDKNENSLEILLAAVEKEVLMGYVKACELAGLLPLLVEIPSVCLTQLTKKREEAVLIVYSHFQERLIVLAKGEKVIATSVLHTSKEDEVIKTIGRIVSYFSQLNVKKVFLSGYELKEELSLKLQKLGRFDIESISPEITGLDRGEVQDFLIPFSMQYLQVSEPLDPNFLSLLPKELVEKYKRERLKLQVWSLNLIITLFVWSSFLLSLGFYFFMLQEISTLKAKTSSRNEAFVKRESLVKEIAEINTIALKVFDIKKATIPPQKIFNEIALAKPSGVEIRSYKLDIDQGKVEIFGISANRDALIEFKNSLEASPNISSVFIPISNFEKETNIEYSVSFNYLPKE